MSVHYGKAVKGKATILHSKVTRMVGECERCGKRPHEAQMQCAHINSRRFNSTRTLLVNAYCLCAGCHRYFTDHPREFSKFITTTWHQPIYEDVFTLARATASLKTDWKERHDFLKEMAENIENGIMSVEDARNEEYHRMFEL